MHVGINAHLLSKEASYRRAGIHTYIAEVLQNLPVGDQLKTTVFSGDPPDFLHNLPHTLSVSRWNTADPKARILWEQLAWPIQAIRQRVDLIHSMAFVTPLLSHLPSVVTVYDLSFIKYPDVFPAAQRLYLTTQTQRSVRAARRVIAISESGRQDLHTEFGVPLNRIDVIYPGLDTRFSPPDPGELDRFKQRTEVPDRYILHVGTLQPRKNIDLLIDALHQLNDNTLKLVLVGGRGWLFDETLAHIERLGLTDQIVFPGYVEDDQLPLWYAAAEAFVCPSLYEGFGMPIIQAMACGSPVLASKASALPEAAGDAAILFDPAGPNAAEALADHLRDVLMNPEQLATMRARGFAQAKRFSWETAGRQTAETYRLALQSGGMMSGPPHLE